ncbi:hypothetical protein QR680_010978 [Steinernema hermaphroditum]|uniref:Uncharacterized protein n=1 Tax=Steinernema hermaphroditum TaxID=289476 RepID=A0AA39MCF4_9BILA|nr:hypothetical protein QR680_010978 [Steinernema hermaphroditum]
MRRSIALLLCALVVLSAAGSNRKKLSPAELVAENAAKKVAKAERDALIQYTLKLLTDARRFMAEAQNIMLNDVTVDTVGMKKIFSAIEYITRTSGTLMKATYKLTDLDLYHEIEPKIPRSMYGYMTRRDEKRDRIYNRNRNRGRTQTKGPTTTTTTTPPRVWDEATFY